ncbi:MAG: cell wall metabolism sensor histidine kinase WalK [Nanoarchaeota archaeon]|nr:cell wall metabolism sensor histidine kinase WalK [Nanoarchaeota archaeon]
MGLFKSISGLFGKSSKKHKENEQEKLIYAALVFITDKKEIEKYIKELPGILKLEDEKKENSYLQLYLNLEEQIISSRPVEEQVDFSKKILKGSKVYTREEIRKILDKKINVNHLSPQLKVIFLENPKQKVLLYELMCQELVNFAESYKIKLKILPNLLKGIRLEDNKLNFSTVNKRLNSGKVSDMEIMDLFSNFFLMLYNQLSKTKNEVFATKVVSEILSIMQKYGFPINLYSTKIIPFKISQANIMAARELIHYILTLIPEKDLIKEYIAKLRKADLIPIEEREKTYIISYIELERFILEHEPPAVKQKFTKESLIKEIREHIDINSLSPEFKLLFLKEREQILEMQLIFLEEFLNKILPLLEPKALNRFIEKKTKDTFVEGISIENNKLNVRILERRFNNISEKNIGDAISDFSNFLISLDTEMRLLLGNEETENLLMPIYDKLASSYGVLSVFSEFLRTIPENIFRKEKFTSLARDAAEDIIKFMISLLPKKDIKSEETKFLDARDLPLEQQPNAFFDIYLDLVQYITRTSPRVNNKRITMSDMKEMIRKKVNIYDLEDRFQLLFLRYDEMLIKLVKDFIKEGVNNFIDKVILVEAQRKLIKGEKLLKGVEISDKGEYNFNLFYKNLEKLKINKFEIINRILSQIILSMFNTAKAMLGELQAKRLFEDTYSNLEKKYGANLLEILKLVPKGILESKRFELLGKEQIQKTAVELTKVETLKDEFMNIAAHELKTPLVPIVGYLEVILKDKGLKHEHKRILRICLNSAKREVNLVNDILDISKIESGSLKLEMEEINLLDLLKEAVDSMLPGVRQKKIYLKAELPSSLPSVNVDSRRLMQVINNLINNATKFTTKGGIIVKAERKDDNILVSVSDTGMGISKENIDKLFTKFFQADTSERRAEGGTGLGLAISKGIIENHNGKMWIKSDLGKGTTFFFTIPMLSDRGTSLIKIPKTKSAKTVKKPKKKVANKSKRKKK